MRGKVGFITPENEIISMPYHKVLSYCQDICNNSNNRDKFIEFAKDYDYFSAYFDYVMFELNYIFINPLFHTGTYLYHCHDSLYLNKLEGFDYSENVREAVKVAEEEDVIPYITRCSQKSMNIKPQTPESVETCMIDPNLIGMMSSTWVTGISHGITANTVLNQLLLTNHNITNQYYHHTLQLERDLEGDSLHYLIQDLGFLRATSLDDGAILIGNSSTFIEEERQFVEECDKYDYSFIDTTSEKKSSRGK